MKAADIITIDKEILGGLPVFKGTRVPVESMFDYLENGISLDVFLEEFPGVERSIAIKVLEMAQKIVSSDKLENIYEAVAG